MSRIKKADYIAIGISIISLIIAGLSLKNSYNSSKFELDKFISELEPTFKVSLSDNNDSLSFSLLDQNAILQGGFIYFPSNLSNEIIDWGYYRNKISISDIKEICTKFIKDNYDYKCSDSVFYYVQYPFPVVINYNAIVNGKPVPFRGLYHIYFNYIADNSTSYELVPQYIQKIASLPIPIKTHTFWKGLKAEVPLEKIMIKDSIDMTEILNVHLEAIKKNIDSRKFQK